MRYSQIGQTAKLFNSKPINYATVHEESSETEYVNETIAICFSEDCSSFYDVEISCKVDPRQRL